MEITEEQFQLMKNILLNTSIELPKRYRCIFTLKNIGGKSSIDTLVEAIKNDNSVLLKHECCYCLGQIGDPYANQFLIDILKNKNENPMVRHEAAEAIGAIGSLESISILEEFLYDKAKEVSETCQIAIDRIKWIQKHNLLKNKINSYYYSVDPAPPYLKEISIEKLKNKLLNRKLPLFKRYRALFSLRNIGNKESILAMAEGLKDESALFRHEIAFVMGQIQNSDTIDSLKEVLQDLNENPMVRHEAAEALGAIASPSTFSILEKYKNDIEPAVKESCEVALDIYNYFNTNEFQYADSLNEIKN